MYGLKPVPFKNKSSHVVDLWPVGWKSDWVASLVEFIDVAKVEQRTKPSSLDGSRTNDRNLESKSHQKLPA
jgi:hypothetical protein